MNTTIHTTPQSKRIFLIRLVALTCIAFLVAACFDLRPPSDTPPSSGNQGSFLLEFNTKFDPTSDDVGAAKTQVDVLIVWAGSRQLGSEESPAAGDTFTIKSTWHGYATDPWSKSELVTNLKPGNWNLSVNVDGKLMTCQSAIGLASDSTVSVTFGVDEANKFIGCWHN
jgi:hypothetical protein